MYSVQTLLYVRSIFDSPSKAPPLFSLLPFHFRMQSACGMVIDGREKKKGRGGRGKDTYMGGGRRDVAKKEKEHRRRRYWT